MAIDLSSLFGELTTPDKLEQIKLAKDQQDLAQYNDPQQPWRLGLARAAQQFANKIDPLAGIPQSIRVRAAQNDAVLTRAAAAYDHSVTSGSTPEEAQMAVLGEALSQFSQHGNFDAILHIAPAYNQLLKQRQEADKLKQEGENTKSEIAYRGALGAKATQDAALAPAESKSKNALEAAQADQARATAEKDRAQAIAALDPTLQKGGKAGATNQRFAQRVLTNSRLLGTELQNLQRLPIETATTGVFGNKTGTQSHGILSTTLNALANQVTPQGAQSYKTAMGGMTRALAVIESSGLTPSQGVLDSVKDSISASEGDTLLTLLQKQANARQNLEIGLETVLSGDSLTPAQLAIGREVLDNIKKAIPFTVEDVLEYGNPESGTSRTGTFKQFLESRNAAASPEATRAQRRAELLKRHGGG